MPPRTPHGDKGRLPECAREFGVIDEALKNIGENLGRFDEGVSALGEKLDDIGTKVTRIEVEQEQVDVLSGKVNGVGKLWTKVERLADRVRVLWLVIGAIVLLILEETVRRAFFSK